MIGCLAVSDCQDYAPHISHTDGLHRHRSTDTITWKTYAAASRRLLSF